MRFEGNVIYVAFYWKIIGLIYFDYINLLFYMCVRRTWCTIGAGRATFDSLTVVSLKNLLRAVLMCFELIFHGAK